MDAQEEYKKKQDIIKAIADGQIKSPHHIPVAVYIQEADSLYHWCQLDKEALINAGLSWELVEDIPFRVGALVDTEAQWHVQQNTGKEAEKKWPKQADIAYELKNRLLNDFRFAFRKYPNLLTTLRYIAKGHSQEDMIQDLNDLSVLGKKNPELLAAIRFDMSLLDKAEQTADEMAVLLAETNRCRLEFNEAKKIRDQAYTHLKEAVDEIREHGRYVFRKNKERFIGYRSNYIRQKKNSRPPKPKPDTSKTEKK